jgi:hypothetical protein
MFVGHYGAALAAKAWQPRAPLWAYVAGCQLLDIAWSPLVMAGVEKARINPGLPGSMLELSYMPFTHSLPAALAWSVLAALLVRWRLVRDWEPAFAVGLVVFSHWALDLIVHRPDLQLWFGGPKVGFSFWNLAIPEKVTEIGILAVSGAAWVATIKTAGQKAWPAIVFIGLLAALQVTAELIAAAPPPNAASFARSALITYLLVVLVSLGFDSPPPERRGARR